MAELRKSDLLNIHRFTFYAVCSPLVLLLTFEPPLALIGFGLFMVLFGAFLIRVIYSGKGDKRFMLMVFGGVILIGAMLTTAGGILYWPDRPNFIRDAVAFRNGKGVEAANFRAFDGTWTRAHRLGQEPAVNLDALLASEFALYGITQKYQARLEEGSLYEEVFLPALANLPPNPGLKNVHIYQTHFPYEGPLYLPAGEYKIKLVKEYEDAPPVGRLGTWKKDYFHYWKIDDIAPYKEVELPEEIEVCYFGYLCWLPPPASNY